MIGIIDWGIGGLSVYSSLRKSGKTTDVVYFSDSGNTPYGKLSREKLRSRFHEIGTFLKSKGCNEVLVACNAASSAIDNETEIFGDLPFHSIIPAAIQCVKTSPAKTIGVIGGERTIESGIYQKQLSDRDSHFAITQNLSAMVEAGELKGHWVETQVRVLLNSLPKFDALLLACTHYPALNPVFKKLFPEAELLDPADEMIKARELPAGKSDFTFFTTGHLDSSKSPAMKAFHIELPAKSFEVKI